MYSYQELCELSDRAGTFTKDLIKRMFGNSLPESYAELGNLGKKGNVYHAGSIEAEVNWTLLSIRRYKSKIELFNVYREIYEDAFLLGDYQTAERYLDKIEAEICYSVWSLENRMILLEFKESPETHKTFLSEINKGSGGYFTSSLAHFLSNRSERNLSVSRYDIDLKNALQKVQGNTSQQNTEFYYFKLNRFEWKKYSHLKDILTYEGYHSVIDRYLALITSFKMWLSDPDLDKGTKHFLLGRVQYLMRKFNDPELSTLYSIYHQGNGEMSQPSFDIGVLDLFTSGLYEECLSELKGKLENSPSEFEYYLLYVRSSIYSDKEFQLPNTTTSFQNSLLTLVYNQLNRKTDPYESMIALQRMLKNLLPFKIANGIHRFLNEEILNQYSWYRFDLLSLHYTHPSVADYFGEFEKAQMYLGALNKIFPSSISIQLKSLKYYDDFDQQLDKLGIPTVIKKIEAAKYLQRNQALDKAREVWKQVISETEHIVPLYEVAMKSLFDVFVEIGEFDQAISLYVDNALKSNYLIAKVGVDKIHEKIRRAKFKNVTPTIDLPLFYTFSNGDENELHIAYERFNRSNDIERPSQLTVDLIQGNKQKWVAYLHKTCTTEIFKHSIYINGSKERYSERILVCRLLLFIDEANEEVYKEEINSLSDILIIQEGLQQLDESKIYVNEQGLMNSELKEFEGLYNRYRTIANIYKESNKKLLLIDKRRGLRLASVEDVAVSLEKDQYSSDPLRDAFADIFDVITRKFLFSKFGISAYLSTRIRHGVLLGEIRPIFEIFNLISQKDRSSNKYKEIVLWNEKYSFFSQNKLEKLQELLSVFSDTIDSAIHDLLKERLQIKTEEENFNGWFDYYFDDTQLALHAINCMETKDYNEFVKYVIEVLWHRTDKNLDEIRYKIQVEVKGKFNEAIEALTTNLNTYFGRTVPEIYTNITTCLTEVHNALDRIAGWFNRSGSQTSDFKLDKLVSIVHENVSHSYPNRRLELVHFEVEDVTLKGEFYTHFADLFRIFLDNALKHSDPYIDTITAEVTVFASDGKMIVTVKNDHPNEKSSLDFIDHENKNLDMRKLSTEGKSGFTKADKIIRSDLKNDSNFYKVFQDEKNQFTVVLSLGLDNLIA